MPVPLPHRRFPRPSGPVLALAALLALSIPGGSLAGQRGSAEEARTLLTINQANVVSALGEIGHPVVKFNRVGDQVTLEARDAVFTMTLGACGPSSCQMVQTRACRPVPGITAEAVNRWNSARLYGRASVQSEGVLCLDDTLFTPDGLVSFAALRAQVESVLVTLPATEMFVQGR